MTQLSKQELLAQLAVAQNKSASGDPWSSVASQAPNHDSASSADDQLDQLMARINQLAEGGNSCTGGSGAHDPAGPADGANLRDSSVVAAIEAAKTSIQPFFPEEPTNFRRAGLSETEVEMLVLKYLLAKGAATGHEIADQVALPYVLVEPFLRMLKDEQLIGYKASAAMNDYVHILSDIGRERAKRYSQISTYYGSAPVSLKDYNASVAAQSIEKQTPSEDDLKNAFSDLLINQKMFRRLGPAINSGRGLFLFGYPGNGKTSIAERITSAFGSEVWIPRAISIDGQVVRVYDPMNHEEAPLNEAGGVFKQLKIDKRWVRIKRPTIIAGGELTMDNLEVVMSRDTGVCEAPLQLKSNCGTLVIDDFGRQKMPVDELLNRWIVPLEKRYDFLNLPGGKKVQVPFDQLIVFSTNLEPRDLCDDAFLRRIPYKIEVTDPSESEFRQLFQIMSKQLGFVHNEAVVSYLIDTHYRPTGRPFRCCQPRDLLLQVKNHCLYQKLPQELTPEYLDYAVENYFAVM